MDYQETITKLYAINTELAESVLCFLASTPNVENTSVNKLLSALRNAADIVNGDIEAEDALLIY
jgi:CTP:molybdopterin cytidylyltransferase MocA